MARIWSLTATAERPSQVTGIRIGGLAFGELDSGTTISVLRLSLSTFTENYNAGPRLANLGTEGRIKRNPSDLTARRYYFHGSANSSRISSKPFSISATSRSWFAVSQARTNSRSHSLSRATRASLMNRERSRDATLRRNCAARGSAH
jgi:hypothetical protein